MGKKKPKQHWESVRQIMRWKNSLKLDACCKQMKGYLYEILLWRKRIFYLMLLLMLWGAFPPLSLSLENENNLSASLWAPCCCSVLVSGDAGGCLSWGSWISAEFLELWKQLSASSLFYKKRTNWCRPVAAKTCRESQAVSPSYPK